MLSKMKCNNGFSLIEIIISVALLSIIAATFLQIFSGSFERIMAYGRENIEHYEAGGELEIAIRDDDYTGSNENVVTTDAQIEVFTDQYVTTSFIQSKSKNVDTKLESGDEYVFAFAEKVEEYSNQAFIDTNANETYDVGEEIILPDDLDGDFQYENDEGDPLPGVLVIPYAESLNETISYINWRVQDGILIKRGLNISVIGDVYIDIISGDLEMNSIIFESQGIMDFNASGVIETQSSTIISNGSSINFDCSSVYLNGFNSRVAIIDNISGDINFNVTDTIYMNQYTFFYNNASLIYAEKNEAASLNIANDINDTDNNEFN